MRGIVTRRLLSAAVAAGLLGSGAAACGNDSSGSGGDGLINVFSGANTGFTPNFNPLLQTTLPGGLSMVYEALFYFNQARADDIQPQLATHHEFADDGRTLNFTTREGVKWSDGKPFSANDVAFTFNLIKNNEKVNTGGLPIVSATATDDTHVTLKFSQGVYTRLSNIAGRQFIVPEHLWSSVSDPASFTNDKPVGTGPFLLKSFSPQSYVLERNPNYWEPGKPKIKGVRFVQFNSNESATAALARGQLDWAGIFIADIDKQYVSKDRSTNKYINGSNLYITNLVPNLDRAPFGDPAVRRAVSLGLDRDQIIKLAFSGYGKYPSVAELPRPLMDDYIKPENKDAKLDFDPAEARRTLEQAGYTRGGDGIYARDGKKLTITCKVVTGYSDYISALQVITQEMKDVGIEFKAQEVSFSAFSTAQEVGDFDMIITNAYSEGTVYSWYNRMLGSKQTAPIGKIAQSNYARYRNPTVDQALDTIAATAPDNLDAIRAQVLRIQDIVVRDMPYIPLQQSSALVEFRTNKVTGWPTEQNHYALTTPFNGPDVGIVAKNLVPAGG